MMRFPSPEPEEQVAAMAKWVSDRTDILDYVIITPHDQYGGATVSGSWVVES
jgi:hypothetical protein